MIVSRNKYCLNQTRHFIFTIYRLNRAFLCSGIDQEGPVVQRIVSLTSSLRGQLVKCPTTLLRNTQIILVEKIREAFALQKLLTFFQQKILAYLKF